MRFSVIGGTVQQIQAVGGTNIKEARAVKVVFTDLSEAQAAKLRAVGCTVNKIGKVKASVVPPAPVAAAPTYTVEQLSFAAGYEDFRAMMDPPLYGAGFNLAIIDTGMRETHEKLKGRVVYSKNFTTAPMRDGFDHGTAVAGVAVAIAPLCNVLNLKVLDDFGEGTEEEAVLAIDEVVSLRDEGSEIAPHVVNLSLGAPDDGDPNNSLRVACRAALEKGIWIFAAAGNEGSDPGTIMSPACEKYVGCLGSVSYDPFVISNFSSRGPTVEGLTKPDGVLFGENLILASKESDTATTAKSGTSFTAPFVSGMAIITREGMYRQAVLTSPIAGIDPEAAWAMSEQDLLETYLPLICIKPENVALAKDNQYGWGLPFGPKIYDILRPIGIDISSMIAMVVVVGMMGMMMRTIK